MLGKSRKQKGKDLERFVAKALLEFDKHAYARADSGSGLHRKEDVFTTLPFFIECKNQAEPSINSWWKQTLDGCPANKLPILIYRLNYQKSPTVVTTYYDLLHFISGVNELPEDNTLKFLIHFAFEDFISVIREAQKHEN